MKRQLQYAIRIGLELSEFHAKVIYCGWTVASAGEIGAVRSTTPDSVFHAISTQRHVKSLFKLLHLISSGTTCRGSIERNAWL